MFKYDLHVHDSVCSRCASASPEELVRAYYEAGMNGFVSTNHFIHGHTNVPRNLPWEERMMMYYSSYERALKEAEKYPDFNLFFGFEHAWAGGREVLVYGADIEFLLKYPEINDMPIEEFCRLFIDNGCVVGTAHPYRVRDYNDLSVDNAPLFVNAVEVYNAHNSPFENMRAFKYATSNDFILLSGGDTHHIGEESIGQAGIATNEPINDSKQLAEILKSGNYNLIIDGNIVE